MTADEYSEVLDIPKYLLREASYKYLPEEIITRKKVGFPVPLTEWFENLEDLANNFCMRVFPGVVENFQFVGQPGGGNQQSAATASGQSATTGNPTPSGQGNNIDDDIPF